MINILLQAGNTKAKSMCSISALTTGRRMLEEPQVPSFLLPVIEVFSVVVVVKLIATVGVGGEGGAQKKCDTLLYITR